MNITEEEYKIKNIYLVLKTSMPHGTLNRRRYKRHSDCLVYVLSGKCSYFFEDAQVLTVEPGNILFLRKNSIYNMMIHSDSYQVIYIDFDLDIENEVPENMVYPIKNTEIFEHLFHEMNVTWLAGQNKYQTKCMSILYQIYYCLSLDTQPSHPYQKKIHLLKPAVTLLLENYTDPELSIQELAYSSQISEGHFRRIFKEVYSISPSQYIRELRIRRAKELLQFSDCTINEISVLSGFNDIYYFSKIFKAQTGYTPAFYKKSIRTNTMK